MPLFGYHVMHTISVNGQNIHYIHNNKRTPQPALILVHGAGCRSQSWPNQWQKAFGMSNPRMRRWVTDYPVYIPDLPGHGKSDGPGLQSVEGYAEVVIGFAEALGLTHYVVCGHSMGAAIAVTVGIKQPAGLAGVISLAGGAKMVVSDLILDGLQSDFVKTVGLITKFSWKKDVTVMFKETGRQHMLTTAPEVVHGDFVACAAYDVREQLGRIEVPMLVVGSSADKMMPLNFSESLADGVAHSQLVAVDAGHFMHFEKTAAVTKAVVEFMKGLEK